MKNCMADTRMQWKQPVWSTNVSYPSLIDLKWWEKVRYSQWCKCTQAYTNQICNSRHEVHRSNWVYQTGNIQHLPAKERNRIPWLPQFDEPFAQWPMRWPKKLQKLNTIYHENNNSKHQQLHPNNNQRITNQQCIINNNDIKLSKTSGLANAWHPCSSKPIYCLIQIRLHIIPHQKLCHAHHKDCKHDQPSKSSQIQLPRYLFKWDSK